MFKKERANQHCADRPLESGSDMGIRTPDDAILPQHRVSSASRNPIYARSSSLTVIVTNARERETAALRRRVGPRQAAREEGKMMGRMSDGTAPVGIASEANVIKFTGSRLAQALTSRYKLGE